MTVRWPTPTQAPRRRTSADTGEPAWRLRLRVRLARRVLDDRLAAGGQVDGSVALSLRATQLTSAPERRAVAAALEHILDAALEREADPGSGLIVNHKEVIASRPEILAVVEALRGESAVDARGVALARVLIERRTSPLARPSAERTLAETIAEIAQALCVPG
jgi:hypothetical protein